MPNEDGFHGSRPFLQKGLHFLRQNDTIKEKSALWAHLIKQEVFMENVYYPRARMRRDSFFSLDGEWQFAYAKSESAPDVLRERITVPYPPESRASGIGRRHRPEEYLFYEKRFSLPEDFLSAEGDVLLHFGAVDQYADVWLNGKHLGTHEGGYLPFHFSIGHLLEKENVLSLRVKDTLDTALPYGKQKEKRGGMWYTPHSGIWGSVWVELVPKGGIEDVSVISTDKKATIYVKSCSQKQTLRYRDGDEEVVVEFEGEITVTPKSARLWSPEEPNIYDFTVSTKADTVSSYFALRKLEARTVNGKCRFFLNGKPYFLNGVLDQGYFEEGIIVPPSPDAYRQDILSMKALGFNMLRKHIKIEPPAFYEACDRLGMIVFQDAVNNGRYSFLWQTALPTVGLKRVPRFFLSKSRRARSIFREHTLATLKELCFYPSVLLFTIFNEGWGQADADALYRECKALYPDMIFDTASGWFKTGESDLRSDHVYFKRIRPNYKKEKKLIVLSEFGGYSYPVEGHLFNPSHNYGYGTCRDGESYFKRIKELYLDQVLPAIRAGVSGLVYTQLSDVEDETNGFYTYDRALCKVPPEEMKRISDALFAAYGEACADEKGEGV